MTNKHKSYPERSLMQLSTALEGLTSESSNSRSDRLDEMSAIEIAQLMNDEDKTVALAVERVLVPISLAIEQGHRAIASGGRVLYVGAGTSGRLGVLDASEIPPTFSASHELFHAIIAGGEEAIFRAQEGVEDDEDRGRSDILEAQVSEKDMVIGLAVSGRTPYVLAAVDAAKQIGATTIGISCNEGSPLETAADIAITPMVGPEILSGSTRLKSGTAQKMVLNMISTGAMVRSGKCFGNRMVELNVTNEKLQARALNLVGEIAEVSKDQALEALHLTEWDVKAAIVVSKLGVSVEDAHNLLKDAGGHLRRALEPQ